MQNYAPNTSRWLRLAAAFVAFWTTLAESRANSPATAPQVEYQRDVSNRINRTGQPLTLPVPFRDGTAATGEILLRVESDDRIFIPKAALLEKIARQLSPKARAQFAALPETEGRVALTTLEAAGFGVRFDVNQLELIFEPSVDVRADGDLSVSGLRGALTAAPTAEPAKVSGYINMYGSATQAWATTSNQNPATGGALDLQGALRLRGVVLETEASVDGGLDLNACVAGSLCAYQHTAGLKRRGSRAIYDLPEPQLRLQVGDTQNLPSGSFLRSTDTLGVSLEKSATKLAPGENIRSVGRSTFRLERNAEVDVIVNGAVVQHYRLRAGTYNLRDLPFVGGANDVELAIVDEMGERKSLKFATFYDQATLGAGKTEWSVSGGVPSYVLDNERRYDTSGRQGTAMLRHGVTDDFTVEVSGQADMQVATGSLGLFLQTPAGVFGIQPATSITTGKPSVAARFSWAASGFRGSFGLKESTYLSAEWRDTNFRTPGEKLDLASQVYAPQALYKLKLSGSHSIALPSDLTMTLSARYQLDNPDAISPSPYTIRGDRYGGDITLARPLTPSMSASILAGYSNESYLHGFAANFNVTKPEFRAAARLYFRPAERSSITASYDTLQKATQLSGYASAGNGIGAWNTTINSQYIGETGNLNGNAGLSYTGNRAELYVGHSSNSDHFDLTTMKPLHNSERTTARVGASVAFADGAVAVGAPIRGQAFAIVKPHPSLANNEITVGSGQTVIAKTDRLGPALVTNLPAYTSSTVPIDVADLPVGYSIGAGGHVLHAPLRAGYALEVGSDYSITAVGTLHDADGQPLALQSGVASPAKDPKKQVAVFTNAAGRFGADGLAPGRWVLTIDSLSRPLIYVIDIPKNVDGLFKAGVLAPREQQINKD